MRIHASATNRNGVAGPNLRPAAADTPVLTAAVNAAAPMLPEWITDTFAAKYATLLLTKVGNTAVGSLVQNVLNDPFVFLNQQLRVGGLNGSVAAATASVVASVAPSRVSGTIVGAAAGAMASASQAMMTFPNKTTVVVATVHGLVRGAIAGNVSVYDKRLSSPALIKADQRLW